MGSSAGRVLVSLTVVAVLCGCRAHEPKTTPAVPPHETAPAPAPPEAKKKDADGLAALKPDPRRPPAKYRPITQPVGGTIAFSYTPNACKPGQRGADKRCKPVEQSLRITGSGRHAAFVFDHHSKCWVAHGRYLLPGVAPATPNKNNPKIKRRPHPYQPRTVQSVQVTLCEGAGEELTVGLVFTHPSHTRQTPSGIPGRSRSTNLALLPEGLKASVDRSRLPKLSFQFEGRLETVSCYRAHAGVEQKCDRQPEGPIRGDIVGEVPSVEPTSRRYYDTFSDVEFSKRFARNLAVPKRGIAASSLRGSLSKTERFSPLYYVQIDPKHRLLLFNDKTRPALLSAHVFDGTGFYKLHDIHSAHSGLGHYGRTHWDSSLETIFIDIDGDSDIDMVSREYSRSKQKDARGRQHVEENERIRVSIWTGTGYRSASSLRITKNGVEKSHSQGDEIRRALAGKTFSQLARGARVSSSTGAFKDSLAKITFKPMYCSKQLSPREQRDSARVKAVCRPVSLKVTLGQPGWQHTFLTAKHGELVKYLPAGRYTAHIETASMHTANVVDSKASFAVDGRAQTIQLFRAPK